MTSAANPSVSVIIPCFNNESSVELLCERIRIVLDPLSVPYEIIFIDDGSTDNTSELLSKISDVISHVVVISLSRNFGQHPAISAGLSHALGDYLILMDADLQDSPDYIPQLIETLNNGNDLEIVYTSILPESIGHTRLTSRLFHFLYSRLVRNPLPRNIGTLRIFSQKIQRVLLDYGESAVVYGPLMSQIGFKHAVIDIVRQAPVGRKSSYRFFSRLGLAVKASLYYGSLLPKLLIGLGSSLTFSSLIYLLVILISYIAGQRELPPGITLLLSVFLLTSGVMLLSIGLLSIYAISTFREVLRRPRFHISMVKGQGLSKQH